MVGCILCAYDTPLSERPCNECPNRPKEYNMTIKEIIEQLESLKDNSADMAKAPDADPIWQRDVEAITAAIEIIKKVEEA